MKKRIISYRRKIDAFIETGLPDINFEDAELLRREHLVQIGFFQHERSVHLYVTLTVALLEMLSVGIFLLHTCIATMLLCCIFAVLLIPYIAHYYLLENEVQKMYAQYDKIESTYEKLCKDNKFI